jgi:hypothetical protein
MQRWIPESIALISDLSVELIVRHQVDVLYSVLTGHRNLVTVRLQQL